MAEIFVAGLSHESNTFATGATTRGDFQSRREYMGDQVITELRGTNTAIGGGIEVAETEGHSLHPSIAASANPGGVVSRETYEWYLDRIRTDLAEVAEDVDGVFLALHGAMVPAHQDDGEGPLIAAARKVLGDKPIVATFDLHGNVTDEMVSAADALIAYETYPHVDMAATGRRAVQLLGRMAEGDVDPVMAIERPPLLAHGPLQNTREGPMARVMERARELEDRPGIEKVNVFPGYHMADIPAMGFSIPVVADSDRAAARDVARELATFVWDQREAFVGDFPPPAAAISQAVRGARTADPDAGPVVVADPGDNPGGGAAGDSTAMLRELLEQEVDEQAGLAIMRDPAVVEACLQAGPRERVTVTIGGKTDEYHGEPIDGLEGYVAGITDGRFRNTGPMATGTRTDLGRSVRLQCGLEDNIAVLVTENRVQPLDAEIWRHLGVQPERFDLLVVKSVNHFRADYEPMAAEVIVADTPGLDAIDISRFEYGQIRRPQYPLDEMAADAYPPWA